MTPEPYPGMPPEPAPGSGTGGPGVPGSPGDPGPTPTPTPQDPLVPGDLAGWARKIVDVVRRSWPQLAVLQLVAAAGTFLDRLANGGLSPRDATAGDVLLSLAWAIAVLVLSLLAQGASVWVTVMDAAGRHGPLTPALVFARRRALPLLGWSVVAGLMTMVGLVAVVLPGLYLALVFSASFAGVVMVERAGIGRCFTLVNARFLPTAGRCVIMALLALAWSLVGGLLRFGPLGVQAAVAAALAVPAGVVGVAFGVVTYAELRWHERPGTGTGELVAQLEA